MRTEAPAFAVDDVWQPAPPRCYTHRLPNLDPSGQIMEENQSERLDEHPLAEHFHRLTPDDVFDAVEVGGRRCTGRFIILNSYENRVYQLELDDGTMVVGKFYRPGRWSREAVEDEHRFLQELAAEELPVVAPLRLGPDRTLGEVQGILYALFPRIGGRAPEELDDVQLGVLGRLVARMHNVGASAPAPHRPELSAATYGRDNLAVLLERGLVHDQARAAYEASVLALLQRIEPLFAQVPKQRIHGDCHLGNLLWTPHGPMFLDFDDMRNGPAVQDVWMLVPSADAEGSRQREVFLEAYRDFRDFDPAWLRLVEPLRALRYVHYATWIATRWQDPAFRRTFPHFGTQQYWEREIQDLREQIARVDLGDFNGPS